MTRFVYNRVDSLIVISDAMANFARREIGITREMHRIYNGFDPAKYRPDEQFLRTAPDRIRNAPRLLCVGRLDDNKNQGFIIQAFQQFRRQFPAATLSIVGVGERLLELQALATRLEVADAVRFLGWSDNVSVFYQSADLLVHGSRYESFGNVVVEAFFTGLPAVATPSTDAFQEVFFGKECGIVTANWDIDEFVNAMTDVLRTNSGDAGVRLRLATAARERFSLSVTIDAYKAVISNALLRPSHMRAP